MKEIGSKLSRRTLGVLAASAPGLALSGRPAIVAEEPTTTQQVRERFPVLESVSKVMRLGPICGRGA